MDALADSWYAGCTTDELDGVDLVEGDARVSQRTLQRSRDAVEDMGDEAFKFLAREFGRGVDISYDRLDVQRRLAVGRQHFLQLFASSGQPENGLGVVHDIDLVLGLELLCKVLDEGVVDIPSSKILLVCCALDNELAFGKGHNRDGEIGVTCIDEDDMAGILCLRKVGFSDAVAKSRSSGVIDETEDVQVRDRSCINHSAALDIGEPARNGDHNIGHVVLEFDGGDVA